MAASYCGEKTLSDPAVPKVIEPFERFSLCSSLSSYLQVHPGVEDSGWRSVDGKIGAQSEFISYIVLLW